LLSERLLLRLPLPLFPPLPPPPMFLLLLQQPMFHPLQLHPSFLRLLRLALELFPQRELVLAYSHLQPDLNLDLQLVQQE
jgi:hypothetical protein